MRDIPRDGLLALVCAAPCLAQETRVPSFDTPGSTASYVVALPQAKTLQHRPLVLDLQGAANPARKGAHAIDRVWRGFARRNGVLVAGLRGRTRAWNMVRGERDDPAYVRFVRGEMARRFRPLPDEIYLAGFSSGADFLCAGGLQQLDRYAGSLIICPGPPALVGLRDGELLRVKHHPFYFVAGEADYLRKDGAWQAFVALDAAGGKAMYREVPRLGHRFPPADEYDRAFRHLRVLAGRQEIDLRRLVRAALTRGDDLLASTYARQLEPPEAATILARIEARGAAQLALAESTSWQADPGAAYEAWWQLQTRFHRFPKLATRARAELARDRGLSAARLYAARRDFFRRRTAARRPGADRSKDR